MAGSTLVKEIVGVSIGLVVAAVMVPLGLIQLANSSSTMQSAGVSPLLITVVCILLPVVAVVGLILYFLGSD
jgi:hypothetical protein